MGDAIGTVISTPPGGVEAPPKVVAAPERPAWLPEKFKTPEDMAKSYAEAQKKISELSKGKTTEAPPAVPPKAGEAPPAVTEETLTKAGLDRKALADEYVANGNKLTPESLKKLNDLGITQADVENAARGEIAKAEDFEKAVVKDLKGGMPALKDALTWAEKAAKEGALSEAEVEAFNKAMESGNPAMGALAAEGLVSKFRRSQGPTLIDGSLPEDRPLGYESRAQQQADIRDPRYKTDPAFREKVMKKSFNSKF